MDRDDDGQFTATVEDDDVVAAIAQLPQPVLTTDVADELNLTRQAADYRFRRLREADRVSSSRVGGSLIWDIVGDDKIVEDIRRYMRTSLPTLHTQRAVMAVVRELRTTMYDVVGDKYPNEKVAWDSLARYLEKVPGLEKPGYGEWGYASDDTAREDLE